jgi:nucleotidyltransferase/DNA polymerase involved in DNA repair
LSLDEVYLDVSENKTGLPIPMQVARTIRDQIPLELTASAGVAPNEWDFVTVSRDEEHAWDPRGWLAKTERVLPHKPQQRVLSLRTQM